MLRKDGFGRICIYACSTIIQTTFSVEVIEYNKLSKTPSLYLGKMLFLY